jgi:hypothetical protein
MRIPLDPYMLRTTLLLELPELMATAHDDRCVIRHGTPGPTWTDLAAGDPPTRPTTLGLAL